VVGFGKIREFEINGESFGNPMGLIDGEAGNNFPRLIEQRILEIRRCGLRARLLPMLDEDAPQLLDYAEQRFAHLLNQNAAQQDAEQAHIPAEWQVFGRIGGAGGQLVKPAALVVSIPK
jgi:hypothetical protein